MGRLRKRNPSAFIVRYGPAWPVTAPRDYVSAGDGTSEDRCTVVAVGGNGMQAVGQETSAAKDLDAVLVAFLAILRLTGRERPRGLVPLPQGGY